MINFNIKGISIAQSQTQKRINEVIKSPQFLSKIGDKALANIKQDLYQGKDPSTRKKHSNKLKKSTIEQRKRIVARNKSASEFYKPNKALVITGQLIRSLSYLIRGGKPSIQFYAKGTHKNYKGSGGKTISNQRLLEIHHYGEGQSPRKMIGISDQGAKSILAIARNTIRKIL